MIAVHALNRIDRAGTEAAKELVPGLIEALKDKDAKVATSGRSFARELGDA